MRKTHVSAHTRGADLKDDPALNRDARAHRCALCGNPTGNYKYCPKCRKNMYEKADAPYDAPKTPTYVRKPGTIDEIRGGSTPLSDKDIQSEMRRLRPNTTPTLATAVTKNEETFFSINYRSYQFWKVFVVETGDTIFVDTQGYDYPRYAAIVDEDGMLYGDRK